MSEPTASQIVAALRGAGLVVHETPGWRDRCRCHSGSHARGGRIIRAWSGPRGITIHHTAGNVLWGESAERYSHQFLGIDGNSDAPGPLCLLSIDGSGRIIMVGSGRCNHLGEISAKAEAAIKGGGWPMTGGSVNWRGAAVDGNTITWGFELMAKGVPSEVQRTAAVKAAAALNRLAGLPAGSVHGHGEASSSRDFSDPGFDMGAFRRDVSKAMSGLLSEAPAPTPNRPIPGESKPTTEELTVSQVNDIMAAIKALDTKVDKIGAEIQKRMGVPAGADFTLLSQVNAVGAEIQRRVGPKGTTVYDEVQELKGGEDK